MRRVKTQIFSYQIHNESLPLRKCSIKAHKEKHFLYLDRDLTLVNDWRPKYKSKQMNINVFKSFFSSSTNSQALIWLKFLKVETWKKTQPWFWKLFKNWLKNIRNIEETEKKVELFEDINMASDEWIFLLWNWMNVLCF